MREYRHLQVWQKAHRLTLEVYRVTRSLPRSELYGLTSQLRRAAVSVPANIAEGCGRGGDVEFLRFLRIASGSASELEYLLVLTADLHLIDAQASEQLVAAIAEVKRMLAGLMTTLTARTPPRRGGSGSVREGAAYLESDSGDDRIDDR